MSKTILVTRAKGDEVELTEALQELGHHVIHEPLTEIFLNHTLRTPLAQLLIDDEPHAIIVTSKHGVQALALLTEMRDLALLCVGSATAESALSLGFSRVYDGGGTLELLIDYIRDGYDDDARFLYISGAHIRSDLPEVLSSFGMACERVIAYEAIAADSLSDTLVEQLRRGQVDAITLFSPRNAAIFCALLEKAECAGASEGMDMFALSDEVAQGAQSLAWQHIFVSEQPTLASLVESVDNSYA